MNKLTKILLVIGGMQAVYNDGILNKSLFKSTLFHATFFYNTLKRHRKINQKKWNDTGSDGKKICLRAKVLKRNR